MYALMLLFTAWLPRYDRVFVGSVILITTFLDRLKRVCTACSILSMANMGCSPKTPLALDEGIIQRGDFS